MQKPKFRTVDKSAWVYVTTRLHPTKARAMNRRTAIRCGYLATAGNILETEDKLPTPIQGEPMREYRVRAKTAG
jgi:hypothetical protein